MWHKFEGGLSLLFKSLFGPLSSKDRRSNSLPSNSMGCSFVQVFPDLSKVFFGCSSLQHLSWSSPPFRCSCFWLAAMESFALPLPSWIWISVDADRSFFSFSSISGWSEPLSGSTGTSTLLFILSALIENVLAHTWKFLSLLPPTCQP